MAPPEPLVLERRPASVRRNPRRAGFWSVLVHLALLLVLIVGFVPPRMVERSPPSFVMVSLPGPAPAQPAAGEPEPSAPVSPPQVQTPPPPSPATPVAKSTQALQAVEMPAEYAARREAPVVEQPVAETPPQRAAVVQDSASPSEATPDPAAQSAPAPRGLGAESIAPSGQGQPAEIPWAYLWKVKRLIGEHRRYPRKAYGARQQGTAVVRIHLSRDGQLLGAHLLRGSGHALLDEEARDVVLRIGRFPPLPEQYLIGQLEFAIDQPIEFLLR
jgi:protein TonB